MTKQFLRLTFIGLISLTFIAKSFGQTTTKEIADKFFALYAKEPIKAVEYAFSTNKWFDRQQDGITNLKNKLKNAIDISGDYCGFELLSEKTAGQSITMTTYIVKYDRQPFRFTFLFYKAKDTWRVNNFSFDDDIDKDLEEATKAYRLKENINW
jgi:hypothetical protein